MPTVTIAHPIPDVYFSEGDTKTSPGHDLGLSTEEYNTLLKKAKDQGIEHPSLDYLCWLRDVTGIDAAHAIKTKLQPKELGPYVSDQEIHYKNTHNRYERDIDGLTISEQWSRLIEGDLTMEKDQKWYQAINHITLLTVYYTDDPEQVFRVICHSKLSLYAQADSRRIMEDIIRCINTRNKRYQGDKKNRKLAAVPNINFLWRTRTDEESEELEWERKSLFKEYLKTLSKTHFWKMIDFVALGKLYGVTARQARNIVKKWLDQGWIRRDETRSYRKGYHWFVSLFHRKAKVDTGEVATQDYEKEMEVSPLPSDPLQAEFLGWVNACNEDSDKRFFSNIQRYTSEQDRIIDGWTRWKDRKKVPYDAKLPLGFGLKGVL